MVITLREIRCLYLRLYASSNAYLFKPHIRPRVQNYSIGRCVAHSLALLLFFDYPALTTGDSAVRAQIFEALTSCSSSI